MKTVWTSLLLLAWAAVEVLAQFECPQGWVIFTDHCYKFASYPRLDIDGAGVSCQTDSAALVSVNSAPEHAFITDHLDKTDSNRGTWLTSGIVTKQPEGVSWLADGTQSTNVDSFWLPEFNIADRRKQGEPVIYHFSGLNYGWILGDLTAVSSYICEIALTDVAKIVTEKRDFDYGLPVESIEMAPRGPTFLAEPVETTILSKTTAAYLDCLADGNPKPSYSWLTGNSDADLTQVVSTGVNSRFILTGGMLAISNPVNDDDGWYQCNATNQYGTILSHPVPLSFGMLAEFSNVASSDVVGKVSYGAVINCPAINAKPAVSYQWHKQKSPTSSLTFIRTEMQKHTFISNSGRLYFSELTSTDDSIYFCTVVLTSLGGNGNYIGSTKAEARTSLGFRLTVQEGGATEFHPIIPDDFIKVYPGNPKRGQNIQLECFAYGTAPLTYRWFRYGKEMPRSANISDSNRILKIDNVQIEDGGPYGCRVDSARTDRFAEKNYTLDIQSEPYFSLPLTPQHLDVGVRLSWHCEARGKPTPSYTWYKDGRLMANSTGVTVVRNTMVIESVNPARDNGMYQCAAKNLYGTTFTSAQIRVLDFAPTFAKQPVDSSLSAAVGGNLTIICHPEAAPTPEYKWLRNGADLGLTKGGPPSGNFQMLANGNLLMTGITLQHQGEYTCKVTNPKGEATSTGSLTVFPNIVISQRPSNLAELMNETAAMVCFASAPPNVDVVYIWRFNGYPINFKRFVEYQMGSGSTAGTLYIVGIQYRHEGYYTCEVTTGMNTQSASAQLSVRGPPGEPSGVFIGDNQGLDSVSGITAQDRWVRLYWSDGLTYSSPIVAYIVEFRTNFDRNWRVHPNGNKIETRFVQSAEFTDKRTLVLKDLKPWAGHEFRVRAINQYGVGLPSLPSVVFQVPGSSPIIAPWGLTGGGGKVGDLTIRWEPMPLEDHNGPNLNYTVNWRQKASNPLQESRWETATVVPEKVCLPVPDLKKGLQWVCSHVTLVGIQNYYSPYEARIRANNIYGAGVWSQMVDVMSAEEMPTATPRNVYSLTYNATALEVHWTPVANNRQTVRGRLIGYRINYWHKDNEVEERARFKNVPVPEGEDNVESGIIIGLEGLEWYWVNIQVITSAGYGPKSEDYVQEVGNFEASLYPTEVHVYSIEGIGVRVNFRGISTKTLEAPLRGYMLQYYEYGQNIRTAQLVDVGRANYGVITNVTMSVLYELRVYGYNDGGQGSRSSPAVLFTVGNGQLRYNPETTEVMAGCSALQCSLVTLLCAILLTIFYAH